MAPSSPRALLTTARTPLAAALVITVAVTVVFGVLPQIVGDLTDVSLLAGLAG